MVTVSGEEWQCEGTGTVNLQLGMGASTVLFISVTTSKPLRCTFILGMDGIRKLGGVTVNAHMLTCTTSTWLSWTLS